MTASTYPDLTLAQAILKAVADHTGRAVRGAEVYAFSDFFQVSVAMADDGSADVTFEDLLSPGSRVTE